MRNKWVWVVLALFVVGVVLLQRGDGSARGPAGIQQGGVESAGGGESKLGPERGPELNATAEVSARAPLSVDLAFGGVVVDEEDQGIEGVSVNWVGLPGDLKGPDAVEWDPSLIWFGRDGEGLFTDGKGRFGFSIAPQSGGPNSYLWLSKAGFVPRLVVLSADRADWPQAGRWVMASAVEVAVKVVDGEGRPIGGAQVSVRGLRPVNRGFFGLSVEEHGVEFLKLQGVTGQDGNAWFSAGSGQVEIRASQGHFASPAWRGVLSKELTLSLVQTFRVGGQVLKGESLADGPHGRVRVQAMQGGLVTRNYFYPVDADLHWGPFDIPLLGEDRFVLSAQGRGWSGVRSQLIDPEAGSVHEIGLEVRAGHDLWAVITDQDEEPIVDAHFSLHWSDAVGAHSIETHTYAGGTARLRGCPSGPVHLEANAAGFRGMTADIVLPQQYLEALVFTLTPGGDLSGVCTWQGDPVKSFDIFAWPLGEPGQALRWSIQGAQGGRFEISGLPLGSTSVIARGPGDMCSAIEVVELKSGETGSVELSLAGNDRVYGRVLDSHGEVPSGAYVQPLIGDQPVGIRWAVDGHGRFEGLLPGVSGSANLMVGGAQCATAKVHRALDPGGTTDVGTIVLQPIGPVYFRVKFQPGFDPLACSLYCQDCSILEKAFDHEGLLIQPRMSEGVHFLQLDLPNGTSGSVPIGIKHGSDEETVFELDGDEQLDVHILDFDGRQGSVLFAHLTPRAEAGLAKLSRRVELSADGRAAFPWLHPDLYTLRIQDSAGEILITRFVQIKPDQQNHLELSLDVQPVQLRLVSDSGAPHSGATVHIHHGNGLLAGTYNSDSKGLVDIFPADDTPVFLCILTQTGEVAWNVPLPKLPADPDQPRDVVLHCNASLRIELYDPSGPLADQPCLLAGDPVEAEVSPMHTTDAQGRTTFSKLTPGAYLVRVYLPGHWPFNKLFEATIDPPITRIKIPRLADLTVHVQNAAGQPLADQPITVWTLDYEKDIKRWWELGALDPSPSTWLTDAQGQFKIPVLPEGPFRISCPGAETTIVLVPGGANLATLQVE